VIWRVNKLLVVRNFPDGTHSVAHDCDKCEIEVMQAQHARHGSNRNFAVWRISGEHSELPADRQTDGEISRLRVRFLTNHVVSDPSIYARILFNADSMLCHG
jgi:hypothetical protein